MDFLRQCHAMNQAISAEHRASYCAATRNDSRLHPLLESRVRAIATASRLRLAIGASGAAQLQASGAGGNG